MRNALVLLDELSRNWPSEGAALAMAILETCGYDKSRQWQQPTIQNSKSMGLRLRSAKCQHGIWYREPKTDLSFYAGSTGAFQCFWDRRRLGLSDRVVKDAQELAWLTRTAMSIVLLSAWKNKPEAASARLIISEKWARKINLTALLKSSTMSLTGKKKLSWIRQG